jgi:hypothetical protein
MKYGLFTDLNCCRKEWISPLGGLGIRMNMFKKPWRERGRKRMISTSPQRNKVI